MSDPTQASASGRAGRHRVVVAHLVMGVAFLGLLVVWALVAGDVVTGRSVRFLFPVPWVLAGVAGLVALVARDRRRPVVVSSGWAGDDEAGGSGTMER